LGEAPADPALILRAEIAGLEAGLEAAQRQITGIWDAAQTAEHSAMEAIDAGNDQLARAALREREGHAERAAALEADVTVLRALLDECRDFLATLPPQPEKTEL